MVKIVKTNIGLERIYGTKEESHFIIGSKKIKAEKRKGRYYVNL